MSLAWSIKNITTLDGRNFGLGHIPNTLHRFTSVHHALARRETVAPPVDGLDLRPTMPRNMNQGQTGSCEAHAGSKGLVGAFKRQGQELGFIPSPLDLYRGARALDRNDPTQPLQDVGTEGNSIIRFFQEYGVRPMTALAPDGRFSDCDPSTINDEPKLGDLETDAITRFAGAYSILDQTLPDVASVLMQALLAFGPVPIASFVDGNPESSSQDFRLVALAAMRAKWPCQDP
jgi:hypothetical protein